jgi:hypothetical protein
LPTQQAGLKINGFQHVAVGDLVESYRLRAEGGHPWTPVAGVSQR